MKPKPHEEEPEEEIEETEPAGAWLFGMFADLGLMGPEPEDEDD